MATIPGTAWLFKMEEKERLERKVSGVARAKKRKTARKPVPAPASGDRARKVRKGWVNGRPGNQGREGRPELGILSNTRFDEIGNHVDILGVNDKWAGEHIGGQR